MHCQSCAPFPTLTPHSLAERLQTSLAIEGGSGKTVVPRLYSNPSTNVLQHGQCFRSNCTWGLSVYVGSFMCIVCMYHTRHLHAQCTKNSTWWECCGIMIELSWQSCNRMIDVEIIILHGLNHFVRILPTTQPAFLYLCCTIRIQYCFCS